MNVRTIVNEGKRGCGYRKEGGLYLMAGEPTGTCGKLPLPLERCPCCDAGIKPSRGWTWVNSKMLFEKVVCRDDTPYSCKCIGCVLGTANLPERMGLLWIGEKFYATPAEFLKEGMAQGVSRRISAIPRDFVLGETLVLFAHAKGMDKRCEDCVDPLNPGFNNNNDGTSPCTCNGTGWVKIPAIFGCFRPTRIEYIVKADDSEEKLEALEKRGITLIKLVRADALDEDSSDGPVTDSCDGHRFRADEVECEDDGQPSEQKENADFAHDDDLPW